MWTTQKWQLHLDLIAEIFGSSEQSIKIGFSTGGQKLNITEDVAKYIKKTINDIIKKKKLETKSPTKNTEC